MLSEDLKPKVVKVPEAKGTRDNETNGSVHAFDKAIGNTTVGWPRVCSCFNLAFEFSVCLTGTANFSTAGKGQFQSCVEGSS